MKYIIYSKITGEYLHSNPNIGWDYCNEYAIDPKIFTSLKSARKRLKVENIHGNLMICKVREIKAYLITDIT